MDSNTLWRNVHTGLKTGRGTIPQLCAVYTNVKMIGTDHKNGDMTVRVNKTLGQPTVLILTNILVIERV